MTRLFIDILVMLLAINGAPVLAAYFLGDRASLPVDLGRFGRDGRAILGKSKTWRGIISALLSGCLLSWLLGHGAGFGLVFASLVMAGDLAASFYKRRRGLAPSDQCLGVDQIPESLLPGLYASLALGVAWWWAVLWSASFFAVEIWLSRLLFRLHIRQRPY